MIPIHDDNPTKSRPVVTYALIAINTAIFAYELNLNLQDEMLLKDFIYSFALIPSNIVQGFALYTLVTSMFLHGGIVHLAGNMLYLYIFGNNIEDIMGRRRFILFYFLAGFAASALQIYIAPYSEIPNLGASGAIAGVLGAYLVRFPRAKVHTIVFLGYYFTRVQLPAILVLGFWFVIQLFSGIGSLEYNSAEGGVAYFAHIGGFVAGLLLVWVFKRR